MPRALFPNPKVFLEAARAHQRDWVTKHLRVILPDPIRVTLPVTAATEGKNFFPAPAVREAVVSRFPAAFALNASGCPGSLAADALRSAHIPFNLFAPLRDYLGTPQLAQFVALLSSRHLAAVSDIGFEFADPRARHAIRDNTSFDAYLLANSAGPHNTRGPDIFLGVEVKYTEGPYSWTRRERQRMFARNDTYHRVTVSSGLFRDGAALALRTRHLKQMWRNMLLGAETARATHTEFIYLHLYPEGNVYQAAACSRFAEHLTPKGRGVFRPTTYERFLDDASEALPADALLWIEYLRSRYLVPGSS